MKKTLLILLLSVFSISFAQVRFEKGYMINNNHEKIYILVKNQDWAYNPTQFIYKTAEDGAQKTGNLLEVEEFGIGNQSRFVRFTGPIDQSTDNLQRLTDTKEPVWERKTVFLKELYGGDRKLYVYNDRDILKFFYSDAKTPITQLIYKRYFPETNTSNVITNSEYKSQLQKYFAGESVDRKIERLSYKENSLTSFFRNYKGFDNSVENEQLNKSKFNMYIKPGIAFSSAKLTIAANPGLNADFASKITPRVGVEAEYVFPFRKNKYSVFAEAHYETYSQTGKNAGGANAEIKYGSMDLALGARLYMFLNENSKFFVDGSINAVNINLGDNYITYNVAGINYTNTMELYGRPNFGFSVGYNYKDTWLLQAKAYTRKPLVNGSNYMSVDYSNITFALGYRFL